MESMDYSQKNLMQVTFSLWAQFRYSKWPANFQVTYDIDMQRELLEHPVKSLG